MDKISFWGLSSTKLSDKSTYWILSHKNRGYETIHGTEPSAQHTFTVIYPPELSYFEPFFNRLGFTSDSPKVDLEELQEWFHERGYESEIDQYYDDTDMDLWFDVPRIS